MSSQTVSSQTVRFFFVFCSIVTALIVASPERDAPRQDKQVTPATPNLESSPNSPTVHQTDDNLVKTELSSLPTVDQARFQAKLLHDTFHGVLQVMHRDFFDPRNRKRIPSASLEDVFDELAENHHIKIRWLGVNAKTMNVDHNPQDDFERAAVKSIAGGKTEHESVEDNFYRRAASIRLHNVCLKCHVPNRTSLEDRAAALVISIPTITEVAPVKDKTDDK